MIAKWRDMTLLSKLAVCGMSFLLPILLLLALLIWQMASDIRLSRVESRGISVLDPLEDITEMQPERLRLVLARLSGKEVSAELDKVDAALRGTWAELGKRLQRHQDDLGLTPAVLDPLGLSYLEPAALLRQVQELEARPVATAEQALDVHSRLVNLTTQLREYVADSAKLVLDPELASYYLMYLLVFDIPRAQERLGWLYASGCMSLAGTAVTSTERMRLDQATAAWEQSVVERILDKLQKAQRALGGDRLASLPKSVTAYADACRAFLDMTRKMGGKSAADERDFIAAGQRARQAGAELWDQCYQVFNSLLSERIKTLRLHMLGVLLGCLGCLAGSGLLAWTIATSITRPLARVARVATSIAEGKVGQAKRLLEDACPSSGCTRDKLAAFGASRSETSQLFSAVAVMIQGLEGLLGALNATGGRLQASAGRIAATARQLEAAATQQAASTVEVGATSKEISATASNLADTMSEVLGVASKSSELAQEGRLSLADMGQAMTDLSQASKDMAAKLGLMREKATGIGQLLSTIAKVANQTNLLSLNAAIEAEKAGEFGPGFAVVAREIRRLADQTASAALDIERTVRDMQGSVQSGSAAMEGFKALADQTSATSLAVNAKLGRIIEAGEQLTPRFSTVTQGMRMQAEGADQISVVISQLADSAGQTRDSLAEFREAAEDLSRTAEELKEVFSRFDMER